jgi:hydrogenase-4 component B
MTGALAAGLLPTALAIRLAVAAGTLAAGRRASLARSIAFGGSALASTVSGLAALDVLRSGQSSQGVLVAHVASGFGYLAHGALSDRAAFLGVAFNVLVGAVETVFAADGVITFLFAWELMTLSTAALVATEHEDRAARRAAYLYLVMSHVGTGCLIAAFFTLASATGELGFARLLAQAPAVNRDVLFALFLAGFGVKAGIIPLHIWLPEAHPAAPSSISSLMSGALIKTGIYGMVRFCAFGLGTPRLSWGVVVLVLGAVSAVLGVLYALMQHDLKRLLAYHSIENIGIILLGLGAGMTALARGHGELAAVGVAAALFHTLNHAIFKGLLFLGAGGVVMATGTRQIEDLGGLLRRMPYTGAFFLAGAAAISALPPLNGFASEWLTFQAFLFGFLQTGEPLLRFLYPVAAALLALTSALAAACFVKAFGIVFLALPRGSAAAAARESPAVMLVPQAFLASLCLVLGLFPGFVVGVLRGVMAPLPGLRPAALVSSLGGVAPGPGHFDHLGPLALLLLLLGGLGLGALLGLRRTFAVRRAATWGCGGELGPRTEYTATAFSKPLMMIFDAVYRPTREVETLSGVSPYFPREVRYRAHIEPTFERFVYGPLTRGVLGLAERLKVLQAGSLHAYLSYVIVLVVGLVLLVWWRS